MLERAMALIEEVPPDELSDALAEDSGDSVTATSECSSEGEQTWEPHSPEQDNTTVPETHGSTDEDLTGDASAWGSSDQAYTTESEPSTEELESDADAPELELQEFFDQESWTAEQVEVWRAENSAAAGAMSRSKLAPVMTVPEGMDQQSGEKPSELFMIDAGTFRHMAGTGAMHLATNIRRIRPHPVLAADGGKMYLDTECDLVLNGCEFKGCMVNPHIRTTLLSEGWMFMAEGWKIENATSGKCLRAPSGVEELAHRRGMIFYLPAVFLPTAEENERLRAAYHDGQPGWDFDQESAMSLCDTELVAMVMMATRGVRADSKSVQGPDQTGQIGACDHPMVMACRKARPDATENELQELRKAMVDGDTTEIAGSLTPEMKRHVVEGHRTKLPHGVQCPDCLFAKMVDKPAYKGTTREPHGLMTCCVDTNDMVQESVNGNRYYTTAIMLGSRLCQVEPGATKDSIATARRWRKMKSWFEVVSDPGGSAKVQVLIRDPGSEFEGAMRTERETHNIMDMVGEPNRHTHAGAAENSNRNLPRSAVAMCSSAFKGDHDQYDELATEAWCEAVRAACIQTNHHPVTASQLKLNMSPIEEQSGGRINSQEYLEGLPAFGELVYGFVPKKGRHGKMSARSFKGLFLSRDEHVKGMFRVMPFESRGGRWVLYPTVMVGKYVRAEGVFPLRANPQDTASVQRCDEAWDRIFSRVEGYEEAQLIPGFDVTADDEYETPGEDDGEEIELEVEDVVGRLIDSEDGSRQYELTWKGYDREDSTWHYLEDLGHCERLINEFEARLDARGESEALEAYAPRDQLTAGKSACIFQIRGDATGCTDPTPGQPERELDFTMGATEIDVEEFVGSESGLDAIRKEWDAMTKPAFGNCRPRLIEMTPEEAAQYNDLKGKPFRDLLKLRYACTQKRATPDQLKIDPEAKGKMKARLVAQDLKFLNPADASETYAPVPEACVFRLMVAAHPISEYDISATDVTTAYLQGDPFKYDESKPKHGQWIPCKVFDPLEERWRFMWMTGEIYGRQPAGCNWHQTLTRRHARIGMAEGKNAKSIYFNDDRTVKTAVHVDDPVTYARRAQDQPYPSDSPLKLKYYQDLAEHLDLKDVETLSKTQDLDYLSLRMSVSDSDEVCISNADYLVKVLDKHGLTNCNPAAHPISKDLLKIVAEEAESELYLDEAEKTDFQAGVGELNWIATTLCPKLALAVSLIGKRCAKPTLSSPKLIKQALRWLAGNVNMCLKANTDDTSLLQVYSDSDHAGMHSIDGDLRSRMGIVATYNGMPILWTSAWIKAVCLSSAEAEVYALAEAAKVAQHLKWICQELRIPVHDQVPIHVDASAAIGFAANLGGTTQSRLKHIDLRRGFVEQLRDSKDIEIRKIDGTLNPANFFTKVLQGTEFQRESQDLMDTVKLPEALEVKLRIRGHGEKKHGNSNVRPRKDFVKPRMDSKEEERKNGVQGLHI